MGKRPTVQTVTTVGYGDHVPSRRDQTSAGQDATPALDELRRIDGRLKRIEAALDARS